MSSDHKVLGKDYDTSAHKEGHLADSTTVTPGMGLEYAGATSEGEPIVQPVSTVEPTDAAPRFAAEAQHPPTGSGDRTSPIDVDYDTNDQNVEYIVARPGDELPNALLASGSDLATASEATVSPGTALAFNDDGSLKEATTAGAEVAVALESVDNSGAAAGEHARVAIEVI